MTGLRDDLAEIDRTIHEPARLAILTALSAVKSTDFLFLQRLTGLTAGNLSAHLSKLEGADLIWIDKQIMGKRPHTRVGLTETGRQATERHWKQLDTLRQHAEKVGQDNHEGEF